MKNLTKAMMIMLALVLLTACGAKEEEEEVVEEKKTEAVMGEVLETMFFEYQVNDAYTTSVISEMTPKEDKEFLVVDITVKNPSEEKDVVMADTDFKAVYGAERCDPLSTYGTDPLLTDELPSSYTLAAGESKTGKLLFVIGLGDRDFVLQTQDHYTSSDREEEGVIDGDVYSYAFTAEAREPE